MLKFSANGSWMWPNDLMMPQSLFVKSLKISLLATRIIRFISNFHFQNKCYLRTQELFIVEDAGCNMRRKANNDLAFYVACSRHTCSRALNLFFVHAPISECLKQFVYKFLLHINVRYICSLNKSFSPYIMDALQVKIKFRLDC